MKDVRFIPLVLNNNNVIPLAGKTGTKSNNSNEIVSRQNEKDEDPIVLTTKTGTKSNNSNE